MGLGSTDKEKVVSPAAGVSLYRILLPDSFLFCPLSGPEWLSLCDPDKDKEREKKGKRLLCQRPTGSQSDFQSKKIEVLGIQYLQVSDLEEKKQ